MEASDATKTAMKTLKKTKVRKIVAIKFKGIRILYVQEAITHFTY